MSSTGTLAQRPVHRTYRKRKGDQDSAPPSLGPFLIATNQDTIKPDAKSRKLIRHHVMKGKRPHRLAPPKRVLTSWVNGEGSVEMLQSGPAMQILEPALLQVLHDFVPIMIRLMYPIERCVDVVEEHRRWFDDLARDSLYAQSISDGARVYFDVTHSQDPQVQALVHLSSALGPLRKQLAQADMVVTDAMIFRVASLALISSTFNKLDDASTHIRGLHQLIKLRGGMATLAQKRPLQIKCCRLDLAVAMRTGAKPILFTGDSLTWRPYLVEPAKAPPAPWRTFVDSPDVRLVNVWQDLREFTMAVNLAHQTNRHISPALFQEVMISVQYRLQHLAYASHDRQETLRLAMLALSTTLFLDASSRPVHCEQLAGALRTSLRVFEREGHDACPELALCLLFVSRISVLDSPEDRPWMEQGLLRTSRALALTSWADVRRVLKGFLWVDLIHDEDGEKILNSVKNSVVAPAD